MMLSGAPKGPIEAVGFEFSSCTFSPHTFFSTIVKSVHPYITPITIQCTLDPFFSQCLKIYSNPSGTYQSRESTWLSLFRRHCSEVEKSRKCSEPLLACLVDLKFLGTSQTAHQAVGSSSTRVAVSNSFCGNVRNDFREERSCEILQMKKESPVTEVNKS
jgi:hypothetical protein